MPDPRVERTRLHPFEDILILAICALLCGAESFEDMELFGDTKELFLIFRQLPAAPRAARFEGVNEIHDLLLLV